MIFRTCNTTDTPENFRHGIYDGNVCILPATDTTRRLTSFLREELEKSFNTNDLQHIHETHKAGDIHAILTKLRQSIKDPALSRDFIRDITGFCNQDSFLFDILRLRCVPHAPANPESSHSFQVHRDSWYANPASQINWWIPVFDVTERQSFRFFPRYFREPIENTSDKFDYDSWSEEIGFQAATPADPSLYPTCTVPPVDKDTGSFSCGAGDIVAFSATHLHQTCVNDSSLTRFSVDFRTVYIPDYKMGVQAPDPDNRSRGDATRDYHSS